MVVVFVVVAFVIFLFTFVDVYPTTLRGQAQQQVDKAMQV